MTNGTSSAAEMHRPTTLAGSTWMVRREVDPDETWEPVTIDAETLDALAEVARVAQGVEPLVRALCERFSFAYQRYIETVGNTGGNWDDDCAPCHVGTGYDAACDAMRNLQKLLEDVPRDDYGASANFKVVTGDILRDAAIFYFEEAAKNVSVARWALRSDVPEMLSAAEGTAEAVRALEAAAQRLAQAEPS